MLAAALGMALIATVTTASFWLVQNLQPAWSPPLAMSAGEGRWIQVDGSGTGQIFEGLGALSAGASSSLLPAYARSHPAELGEIEDFLFCSPRTTPQTQRCLNARFGAALQVLKVEIGADSNTTDGSEPSPDHSQLDYAAITADPTPATCHLAENYEWSLMAAARTRNPNIKLFALQWGAPGWVGDAKGSPYTSNDINHVVAFLRCAVANGTPIDQLGTFNESRASDHSSWIKALSDALNDAVAKHWIPYRPLLIAADDTKQTGGATPWDPLVSEMLTDPQLAGAIDRLSGHVPLFPSNFGSDCSVAHPVTYQTDNQLALATSKPLVAGEDYGAPWTCYVLGIPFSQTADWSGALFDASLINRNYIIGGITESIRWSLVSSTYPTLYASGVGLMRADQPWSGHYVTQAALWIWAHTTQFTDIGWQYIDGASGYLPRGGTYVTLRQPRDQGNNYTIVIETRGSDTVQSQAYCPTGGLPSTGAVHVWQSSASAFFVRKPDQILDQGCFTVLLPPNTVTTVTTTAGQARGTGSPPPSAPFSTSYLAGFDDETAGAYPNDYLAPQTGTFTLAQVQGESMSVGQVVERPPVQWGGGFDPYHPTDIFGDIGRRNFCLSAEVLVAGNGYGGAPGYAGILARTSGAHDGRTGEYDGYELRIYQNGNVGLYANGSLIPGTAGSIGSGNAWHNLKLCLNGSTIRAFFDRSPSTTFTITDSRYAAGMAGIVSGWNLARYDQLELSDT